MYLTCVGQTRIHVNDQNSAEPPYIMSEGVTTTVDNTLDPDEESRLTGEISDRWISGKMEAYFQK